MLIFINFKYHSVLDLCYYITAVLKVRGPQAKPCQVNVNIVFQKISHICSAVLLSESEILNPSAMCAHVFL